MNDLLTLDSIRNVALVVSSYQDLSCQEISSEPYLA